MVILFPVRVLMPLWRLTTNCPMLDSITDSRRARAFSISSIPVCLMSSLPALHLHRLPEDARPNPPLLKSCLKARPSSVITAESAIYRKLSCPNSLIRSNCEVIKTVTSQIKRMVNTTVEGCPYFDAIDYTLVRHFANTVAYSRQRCSSDCGGTRWKRRRGPNPGEGGSETRLQHLLLR